VVRGVVFLFEAEVILIEERVAKLVELLFAKRPVVRFFPSPGHANRVADSPFVRHTACHHFQNGSRKKATALRTASCDETASAFVAVLAARARGM
jgi:hypothetical protein